MPESNEKVCVICGKSCAGQPRIKNQRGEYAHQACAEARKKPAAAPAPAAMDADGLSDDEALMGALLDDAVPLEADGVAAIREGCSGCGMALPAGTVVCMSCGHDTRTGKGLKTVVKKSKERESRGRLTERSAAAAGASHLIGATIGAALGGAVGAAIWAGIIVAVQFQASMVAIVVAALCGIGAAYGARANVSVLTGLIALVFAVGAIVAGKWYGGSAIADKVLDKEVAMFHSEWDELNTEDRAWFVQDDHARDILIARLERGNDGGIKDFTYQMALASDDYPESFPADVVAATDEWWWAMDDAAQADYIERFPEKRVGEYEAAREEIRQMGFFATLGVRDLVYFVIAIFVAAGLGSNENTAPFIT